MARSFRTNNKDRWELYSSIAEGAIGTFKTKEELIAYIAEEKVYEGKVIAIREMMCFPSDWFVNEERQPREMKEYNDWYNSVLMAPDEQYFELIDKKYNELMDKIK